jgi:hypothetical protein
MVSEETKKVLQDGKERRERHAREDREHEEAMERIRKQALEDEKKGS